MPLLRSRMVSVRLSPAEYGRFEEIREARQLRSISDLARAALLNLLAGEDGKDPLSYELHDLRSQVRSLSSQIEKMANLIEARNLTPYGAASIEIDN